VTFTAIKTAIKDYCLLTSTEADTRIGTAVNRHYRRITSLLGLNATRFVTRSQSTTTGVAQVTFTEIEKIDRVLDGTDTASIRLLTEVSIHEIRSAQPSTSAPTRWALQNTDADSVTIITDSVATALYSLQADGWITLADLSGTDEPNFPESFHDVLVWAVIAEELLKKEKLPLAQIYMQKAEQVLSDLRFHLADSPTRDTQQASETAHTGSSAGGSGGSGTSGTLAYSQTSLLTFHRGDGVAPFAVQDTGATYVPNLGAEFLGNITTDRLIGRDTAGTGETEELALSGGLEFTGSAGVRIADLGVTTAKLAADAVTYAKIQNVSATSRLLGRKTAAAGDTEECTLSEVLDFIGSSAHGDILYRGASAWARLAAGTSGYVLQTLGSSTNPAWAFLPTIVAPGGRLTLTTATPVTTADVTAATTLYYTPFRGNVIALYSGSAWVYRTFTELSITLASLTANLPYDVFVYDNASTATLELTAWTNTTTRATALVTQDGIYVKTGATTRRYVGTICITGTTGQCEDSAAKRLVWNYYHRVPKIVRVLDGTDSWTYAFAVWRQARAATTNQIAIVHGVAETPLSLAVLVMSGCDTASIPVYIAIGEDSTSSPSASCVRHVVYINLSVSTLQPQQAVLDIVPAVGYHYYAWLEYAAAGSVNTFYGDNGGAFLASGMTGQWAC
jgi:hypothetical protein